MNLHLNSKSFQANFITPIIEVIKDGRCAVFCEEDTIFSVTHLINNTVYLYNTYKPVQIDEFIPRFNVNLEKLKKGMMCIGKDFVNFEVQKNNLSYKDEKTKMTVRLLEDSSVAVARFNVETFKKFPYNFEMKITADTLNILKRSMDFAVDTSKFYLQQDDGEIFILFGDKQANHSDSMRVALTKEFTGQIEENVYDTAILNLVLKLKDDIIVKISDNGALLMKIDREEAVLNYITPKLKK